MYPVEDERIDDIKYFIYESTFVDTSWCDVLSEIL